MATQDRGHYALIRQWYDRVVDVPAAQRAAKLREGGLPEDMVREVLELASTLDHATSQLTRALRPVGALLASDLNEDDLTDGSRLGPWALDRLLAEGGMGRVYLAHRADGHFEQQAAIKVLAGVAGPLALERLAQERQILARLKHPHIATLLDGGATPAGHPYLAMEFVQGEGIDAYCRREQLDLPGVLRLYLAVLDAVAFAHRQLVIHCDLKPSNIMVEPGGRVVLLDFGIATLMGESTGLLTQAKAYTPLYASPEQSNGDLLTTATDIYSLGLVLQLLLPAGHSAELAAVVGRATQARPADRYDTVEALASDIKRFVRHLPLMAVPRRPPYLLRKLLQRQWPWVSAGTVFAASVVLLTVGLLQQRNAAEAARQEAERQSAAAQQSEQAARSELARAEAGSEFLQALFVGQGPEAAKFSDGRGTVRDLLHVARQRLGEATGLALPVRARQDVMSTLIEGFKAHGQPELAHTLMDELIAYLRQHRDVPGMGYKLANILADRAISLVNGGHLARARPLAHEAAWLMRNMATPADYVEAVTQINLAVTVSMVGMSPLDWHEQEGMLQAALAKAQAIDNASARQRMVTLMHNNLGSFYQRVGQYEQAMKHARLAVAAGELPPEVNQPSVNHGAMLVGLGQTLSYARQLDEAEAVWRRLLAWGEPKGEQHFTGLGRGLLAYVLVQRGDAVQAKALAQTSLQRMTEIYGANSLRAVVAMESLALAHEALGEWPAAEATLRAALAVRERTAPEEPWVAASGQTQLARYLCDRGRCEEAQALLDKAQPAMAARFPLHHVDFIEHQLAQLAVWVRLGDLDCAEHGLSEFNFGLLSVPALVRGRTQALLAELRERQGRLDEALLALKEAEAAHRGLFRQPSPRALLAPCARVQMLARQGRRDEARALRADIQQSMAKLDGAVQRSPAWVAVQRLAL